MDPTESQPPSVTPTDNPDSVSPPSSPIHDPDPLPSDHAEELHHELQRNLDLTASPAAAAAEEEEKVKEDWDGWGVDEYNDDKVDREEKYGGYNYEKNDEIRYERISDDDGRDVDGDGDGDGKRRFFQFPLRQGVEDCAYYMKTGNCKFGANCKFNHPLIRKTQIAKEKVKDREEGLEKLGETECKFYMRTGGCKFGSACRFSHSNAKTLVPLAKYRDSELNFLGLPIRLGEKECPYYMRNGSCKYAANCRFNHPDPTAVGGSETPAAFSNGASTSVQGSSKPTVASWSTPHAINGTAPFVPIVFPPTHVVPSPNAEWNGYQAPVYPPDRSMYPPAYVIGNPAAETNILAHQPHQPIIDEFPERPGQPECSFFMKTGDCKFKSNCKYHHPKNRISKSSQCVLNDKGLPLRPGQSVCGYYSRYGICKFGPGCKFDHSIQLTSTASSDDQHPTTLSNSSSRDEARMATSRNETSHTIQQSV